ncbi:hypothetical protein ACK4CS_12440 [Enterococcus gallinarum]|nr:MULTISPECIES: hypothetical protein [Enterococcus]MBW5472905.1 hypothetical protein [Enterococcus gallinarum]MCB7449972.1 hypothetical protein [Enterococcus gallinarum]MCD5155838.1 hypothetical protein [Enterococcus gallinarum]MCI1136182.1 hypothetical protein [Enterococcus gallinarum]MDL4908681.1 hypothetical protein [Enterococcus gallinarum]
MFEKKRPHISIKYGMMAYQSPLKQNDGRQSICMDRALKQPPLGYDA